MRINGLFPNINTKSGITGRPYVSGATKPCFSRNSNLSPLEHDTVSFTAAKRSVTDHLSETAKPITQISDSWSKKMDKSERAPLNLTQKLYDESGYAFNKLKLLLQDAFPEANVIDLDSSTADSVMTRSLEESKDKPVVMITARRKSPNSIAEKMASSHIRSKKGAKEELHDLIGARIIVSGTSTSEGEYVLDRLAESVKKGRFKVAQVKNHSQENPKLSYVSKRHLNRFIDVNRKKNGASSCEYIDAPRDSGYLAIHIITDEIADGFSSEIQIMGLDVERFKEIEDICYKCHAEKGVDKKYKPLEELFAPVVENKRLRKDYLEYTKRAYEYERLKPIHDKNEYDSYFPIPKDLDIPKELDFNNIARLKARIDTEERRQAGH